MQVQQRSDRRSPQPSHPTRRDQAGDCPGRGGRNPPATADHGSGCVAGDCPASLPDGRDWRRAPQARPRLALCLARPLHPLARRQRDRLSPVAVGGAADHGVVSSGVSAHGHATDPRRVSVRLAADRARRRGAHVLSRLPAHVKPQRVRTLADGSYLAYLHPSDYRRRKHGERVLVRVITYTISDPALPGYGEEHRVITTLLNARLAPAREVACAYHERWEIEIVIDEIDTHQRLVGRTLRSLTPVGVIQELYGVLLAHYAVRVLMHEAAVQADLDPDRLSFVHALEIVRDAVAEFQMIAPAQQRELYERMLRDIAAKRLPERRLRSNARVVKRKMSNFKLKRPEHYQPPKPQGTFRDAVVVRAPPVLELPQLRTVSQGAALWELRQPAHCLI